MDLIVLNILEALIVGRTLERRVGIGPRLPKDDFVDLFGQYEILVGDPLSRVVHQLHGHECIGDGEVGMMPGRFGEVPDGIDDHQGTLPAGGLVLAAYPAVLEGPAGQLLC